MKVILIIAMLIIPCTLCAGDFPSKGDIYWMTQNIYHEARSEPLIGQIVVGLVTLERLADGRWGNTIKKVVTSKKQFSWYSDGKSDVPTEKKAWNEVKGVAILSYIVYNIWKGSGIMYYHNQTCKPYWSNVYDEVMTIGQHTFYKET